MMPYQGSRQQCSETGFGSDALGGVTGCDQKLGHDVERHALFGDKVRGSKLNKFVEVTV